MAFGHYRTKKPERAKRMSKTEVAALLWAARQEPSYQPFDLFFLMYILALRIGEVCELRHTDIKDVDQKGNIRSVTVPSEKKGRVNDGFKSVIGSKKRKRPESERPRIEVPVLAHFDWVREAFNRPATSNAEITSPYLFPSPRDPSRPVSARWVHEIFLRCRNRAGLSPLYTSHALRHTAATELAQTIDDGTKVAAFLRHERATADGVSRVTQRYIHWEPRHYIDAIKARTLLLPPLKPLPGRTDPLSEFGA